MIVFGSLVAVWLLLLVTPTLAAGERCDPATDDERITTHLRYVESVLRERATTGLSHAQREARLRNLDRLHAYVERGEYPENDDYVGERVPYFVDDRGVQCAVAYLVSQSGRDDIVEAVVKRFNNARVHEMRARDLIAWADREGLTVDELALIQPDYCGGSCQSSDPCVNASCGAYSCAYVPIADGSFCRSTYDQTPELCYERVCMQGSCVQGRPRDCDDGDPSTVDSCDSGVGCVNEPEVDVAAAEEGSCALAHRRSWAGSLSALLTIAALLFARRSKGRGER